MTEEDNAPSFWRKQHGDIIDGQAKATKLYDFVHSIGIIDDGQHSDIAHYNAMREAFFAKTSPRDTILGKMQNGDGLINSDAESGSLSEKYFRFLKDVPKVTQVSLEALSVNHSPRHTARKCWQAKQVIHQHLDILRKWLDAAAF